MDYFRFKNKDLIIKFTTHYIILSSEKLGIYAYGKSVKHAQLQFNEDFNFIYKRYNELTDDELTEDVKKIKKYMNALVEKGIF